MKSITETIMVKDLDELPYVVTIPIRVHINAAKKSILSGNEEMQVTVARVGKKSYPIGNMDVLAAYLEIGHAAIPCAIEHIENVAGAQMRHIRISTSTAINPFVASEAVEYVKARDESMVAGTENNDYTKISKLKLAPEIKSMMSTYITDLGEKIEHIPSFLYVFKAVSKLNQDVQVKAMEKVLSMCDRMAVTSKHYTLPMTNTLTNMMMEFDTKTPKVSKHETKMQSETHSDGENGADGEKKGDGKDSKKNKSKNDVKVEEADDMPGYYHNVDTNNVDFACECGQVFKINKKSLTVRKREEQEKMILLVGDYGIPMYAIRSDIAEFLDLSMQPSIYYYTTSKEPHGNTAIITKKKITDETLREIMAVLEK